MHQITYKKPIFSGKGNISSVSSLNNSLEAKWMRFIFPALWWLQFGHHRIVTDSEQYYPFVPHSHANLHFCAFRTLVYLI